MLHGPIRWDPRADSDAELWYEVDAELEGRGTVRATVYAVACFCRFDCGRLEVSLQGAGTVDGDGRNVLRELAPEERATLLRAAWERVDDEIDAERARRAGDF